MRQTLLVALREVKARASTKSYIATLLISTIGVMAAIIVPKVINNTPDTLTVGFVSSASQQTETTWTALASADLGRTKLIKEDEPDDTSLKQAIENKQIDLGFSSTGSLITNKPLEESGLSLQLLVATALDYLQKNDALTTSGLSQEQLEKIQSVHPRPVESIKQKENAKQSSKKASAFVGILLSFLLIQTYGSWILMSTIEEKSSRVVEVLLAVMKPANLLAGKVIGISAAALLNALTVGVAALSTLSVTHSPLIEGVTPGGIILSLVWACSGFILFAWLFAAAGSMCNRIDEAQNIMLPITIPLIAGYLVSVGTATSGIDSPLLKIFSYFPLTAPFAAQARWGIGAMPLLQQIISLILVFITSVIFAKIAAYIFAGSILKTSKKNSWINALKGR